VGNPDTIEELSAKEGINVTSARKTTSEWTLWVVAASCALHVTEEYFTGWQEWAVETLGIVMPTTRVMPSVMPLHTGWRLIEIVRR